MRTKKIVWVLGIFFSLAIVFIAIVAGMAKFAPVANGATSTEEPTYQVAVIIPGTVYSIRSKDFKRVGITLGIYYSTSNIRGLEEGLRKLNETELSIKQLSVKSVIPIQGMYSGTTVTVGLLVIVEPSRDTGR